MNRYDFALLLEWVNLLCYLSVFGLALYCVGAFAVSRRWWATLALAAALMVAFTFYRVANAANLYEANGRDCVALAVYSEGRGEPWSGQEMIAAVVQRRAVTSYDGDLCAAVHAPRQFEGIERWHYPRQPGERAAMATAYAATDAVLLGEAELAEDCVGATGFYRVPVAHSRGRVLCIIGAHVFVGDSV